LEVLRRGRVKINPLVSDIDLEDIDVALCALPDTCALDVANRYPGGLTLEKVGKRLGITRERVRQIEVVSLDQYDREWVKRFGDSSGEKWWIPN
jgi:hypothetical protein